jgi:aldehyde:ferredoxin oxidoreductase
MGAVMGSKNLKAIVVKGSGNIPVFDANRLREMGKEGYGEIKGKENYDFWIRQGTMQVFEWSNENSCLPTCNFREGSFRFSKRLDGYALEGAKVDRKGCPLCNMQCGNIIKDVVKKKDLGEIVFEGVRRASERLGGDSRNWAMHVKGLEISAYNCHACPGMALSYGTSPIGAHQKDAWVISWEISTDRFSYSKEKVEKVIELQRLREGWFESMTTYRLPWVEVDFGLHWYPKYLEAARGEGISQEEIAELGDRIYTLIRSYWIRENRGWSRERDYPPSRWVRRTLDRGGFGGTQA